MPVSTKRKPRHIPNTPIGSIWSRGRDIRKCVEMVFTRRFACSPMESVRYVRVRGHIEHGQHYSRTISLEGWARWRTGAMRRTDLEKA